MTSSSVDRPPGLSRDTARHTVRRQSRQPASFDSSTVIVGRKPGRTLYSGLQQRRLRGRIHVASTGHILLARAGHHRSEGAVSRSTGACSAGTSTSSRSDRTKPIRCFSCAARKSAPRTRCVRKSARAARRRTGTAYVTVANADEAAKKAQELGAQGVRAAVRRDGRGPHGGAAGSDRRRVSGLGAEEAHRREDPRGAGRALLDRAHDRDTEGGREVLHPALRMDREATAIRTPAWSTPSSASRASRASA